MSPSRPAPATLYVILGSHACRASILMCDHKGIDYRTATLPTGPHPLLVRLRGFSGERPPRHAGKSRPAMLALLDRLGTVPALRWNGERIQTNRRIARFLDARVPDPPLFPSDADLHVEVEAAELWGDEVLQMAARRIVFCAGLHGRGGLIDGGSRGRLGPLLTHHEAVRRLVARTAAPAIFATGPAAERELLESLPQILDRVDDWIEAGVLGGEQLNAADFMIAPSVALLCYRPDLVREIESRPVGALIDRLLPAPA